MNNQNSSRFLKSAAFFIAFAILVLGTITHEKNAQLFTGVNPSMSEANVIASENTVPSAIGECEQIVLEEENEEVAAQSKPSLFAKATSLDDLLTTNTFYDVENMNALGTAITEGLIEGKVLESNKEYEFVVKDQQTEFWKCVLNANPLFDLVSETVEEDEFLSTTEAFNAQIEKFGYAITETQNTDRFLNFVDLPTGNSILETTVFFEGETFFKVFETELPEEEMSYNDLRKELRARVGITNLRPAVFDPDSYYWMWGENNKMAATVFSIGDKVFGISYQTNHFKHIRRVIDALRTELTQTPKEIAAAEILNEIENAEEAADAEPLVISD